MMELNKALFISQEIKPYLPANTMSTLGCNVPQRLQEKGVEVRTFMPKYGRINERRNQLHEVIRLSGLNIVIDDTDHPLIIKVATLLPSRMQVYFIDNDDYFHRQGTSTTVLETESHPEDNDERIMFFARGVIETVKKLRWVPGMVHCSGWATALAPLYIRKLYADDPTLANSKIIYSIFDSPLPSPLDSRIVEKMKMDGFAEEDIDILTKADVIDKVTLGKIAIRYSDAVIIPEENADPELVEFARAEGKPILEAIVREEGNTSDPEFLDKYYDFYMSL